MKFDSVFKVADNSQKFHLLSMIFNQLRSHIKIFVDYCYNRIMPISNVSQFRIYREPANQLVTTIKLRHIILSYFSPVCRSVIWIWSRNQPFSFPCPELSCQIRKKVRGPRHPSVLRMKFMMLPVISSCTQQRGSNMEQKYC